ncbi:MAG: monomethylamine:corrinoid methyltransferase, partial [Candidatus Hodarchaeales archaeon]
CYDVKKVKPSKEYLNLYRNTRKELEDIGVPFIY